jgi:hypothetical protein
MKSSEPTISALRRPASIVPGHQAIAGTRLRVLLDAQLADLVDYHSDVVIELDE